MSSISCCFEPVEKAWRPAKSLIVVTNGALGLLPLGLLPTEPIKVTPKDRRGALLRLLSQGCMARTHARHCGAAVGRRAAHVAQCGGANGQA